MFDTKAVTATCYRSHCENSLYYRTSREHGLYGSTSCCISQCPVHYPVKFDANIFIQSGVIDIFLFTYLKIQDGGGFLSYVNLVIPACRHCGICVLYQIWFKYMLLSLRSTHLSSRPSLDDVTRINFRFQLLVRWSSPHGCDASSQ